jgi:hypothetical protein
MLTASLLTPVAHIVVQFLEFILGSVPDGLRMTTAECQGINCQERPNQDRQNNKSAHSGGLLLRHLALLSIRRLGDSLT